MIHIYILMIMPPWKTLYTDKWQY